ncbi:DNA-directed RNA polymerase subunit [Zea mays]|uniref:DNA-directed RNA polymerase subunit n=2 Tax=Zea mays TaxID=4577 RepID=A0A1D6IJK4_MAIZE|nr:DNA-directed RNA polymerase subunit [Zea mays]ONM59620.1 DNA-directed RNA polymerase subunit [Zea mays]
MFHWHAGSRWPTYQEPRIEKGTEGRKKSSRAAVAGRRESQDSGRGEATMSTLKFCRECNNMLYPREDKETRTLLYACQTCEHEEIATDTCVYKRVIRKPGGEPKDVLKDAATDPSLPRTRSVRCYNCNHPEAAFFQVCTQAPTKGEQAMTLYFICCNPSCGHRWRD